MAGQTQNVHRAVGQAEEHAARAEDHGGPDWRIRHVAEAELYSLTGAGYAALALHDPGQAGEAIRRLRTALELRGIEGARNATLDRISLAEAHLADHDLDQALLVGVNAAHAASGSSSRRVRTRLAELAVLLRPHHTQRGVSDALQAIGNAASPRTPRR